MDDYKKVVTFCDKLKSVDECPYALKELSGISEETKKILLEVIKKYQKNHSKEKSGYIESELIHRFLEPTSFIREKITEIEGPMSVCQMSSDKYPHIFYIFGDYHVKKSNCGDIPKFYAWIKETIVNSPVFIDVYLETPYHYKNYASVKHEDFVRSYMGDFYQDFKNCFLHSKTENYCQTSRFHYTDMRRIFKTFELIVETNISYRDIYRKEPETISYNIRIFNDLVDYMLKPDSIVNMRIRKQFNAIKHNHIKNTLIKEFTVYIKTYKDGIRHLELHESDVFEAEKVIQTLKTYRIHLMDYYLIARCFRSYDKKKGYSRPSYNNIIYAGWVHDDNYFKILKGLGYKTDIFIQDKPFNDKTFQCLDISKLKQPLFHQRYI